MSTDNKAIHKWLKREVEALAQERGLTIPRAFTAWILTFVHEVETDQAIDATDTLVGAGGGDGGVDAWFRDDEDQVFHIWQCKWTDDPNKVFDRTAGDELLDAFSTMLNATLAKNIGSKFAVIADDLRQAIDRNYSISLNVGIPTSLPSKSLENLAAKLKAMASGQNVDAFLRLYDAEHLHTLDRDRNPDNHTLQGQELDFDLANEQVMSLSSATALPAGWEAIVANISADSLGRQARKYGTRLFSLNVRYALSRRQTRIERIHNTLEDPEAAPFFWFYNNGITMLADKFEFKSRPNGQRYLVVENPQVVNGCQTVSAFSYQLGRYDGGVSVLVRIIRPPNDGDGRQQALLISENTNTQTPVSPRDLRTNDRIHRDIQAMMKRLSPPWYYEIKRGQWNARQRENAESFGDRRLDMERLAQSFIMQMDPAEALTKKKGLFEDQSVYDRIFVRTRIAVDYLFPELCRRYFEKIWHKDRHAEIRTLCGDQMGDSVLVELLSAKGQVVSHSVALTRQLFEAEGLWSGASAQQAFEIIDAPSSSLAPWMRHLGRGFYQLLEHAKEIARAEGRDVNWKKYLERADRASFVELWNGISSGAGLWLGQNWRKKVVEQIKTEGASHE